MGLIFVPPIPVPPIPVPAKSHQHRPPVPIPVPLPALVTTRLEKVGEQVKYHTNPYFLPYLTIEESCKLLQKKVFQKEDCPPELQDVSQTVAEKCKGLPFVIVLVAGIIKKRKMEESWWNLVKDSLFD
ncbi:hypothetical protein KY289_001553 [Solanum tuberosum]|nr:hypothetical protein KY289_001553 [Solanum tuberosum]